MGGEGHGKGWIRRRRGDGFIRGEEDEEGDAFRMRM